MAGTEREQTHLSYCGRCAAEHADEDPAVFAHSLLASGRRRLRVSGQVPVVLMPEMVDEHQEPLQFLAAAS